MEIAKDFLVPLVIALITVAVTAIVTVQITYSSTKEEALGGLKSLGGAALYYVWIVYLVFSLFFVVASEEPLTRPDAFKISIITISLALLLVLHLMKRTISIMSNLAQLHYRHIDLFEHHLGEHHQDAVVKEKSSN